MFRPNITGQLLRKHAKRTVTGQTLYGAPTPISLAIVTLGTAVEESTVRADSGASRGSAEVTTLNAKLLLPASIVVANGDVIHVQGYKVEIAGVSPRNNVLGRLDHWEVVGNIKAD
jgi:hypothetical protein